MTIVDEKEILEVERIRLEVSKYLKEGNWNMILKFYSAMLATIAVTATVTKYVIG